MANLRQVVTSVLSHLEIRMQAPEELEARMAAERAQAEMHETRMDPALASDRAVDADEPAFGATGTDGGVALARRTAVAVDPNDQSTWGKVPRNAACPCGSGKKFKQCHGRLA